MLRLIGLVVVVLLVLSLAHGERTGTGYAHLNARAETLVDGLTGALADGVRALGDLVFGPADNSVEAGGEPLRDLNRNLDGLARSADSRSRRAMAQMVLRACPSLGLVCQPVGNAADPARAQPRRISPEGSEAE